MKRNAHDRAQGATKVQKNTNHTLHQMEFADELISLAQDEKLQGILKDKTARRNSALEALRKELQDEMN